MLRRTPPGDRSAALVFGGLAALITGAPLAFFVWLMAGEPCRDCDEAAMMTRGLILSAAVAILAGAAAAAIVARLRAWLVRSAGQAGSTALLLLLVVAIAAFGITLAFFALMAMEIILWDSAHSM